MATQLTYDIVPDKSPLYTTVDQLNQSTADLTVTAQNSNTQPVTVNAILVELKKIVNGGADSVQLLLPGSEGGIEFPNSFTGPAGSVWSVTGNDGQFTLKPQNSVTFQPGDKLTLNLAKVVIREGGTGTALVPVFEGDDSVKTQTQVGIGITQSTLTVQLTADQVLIGAGQTATLKWTTQDATSGVLTMPGSSPDILTLDSTSLSSGEHSVTPIQNVTYSLTCQGRGPNVRSQVTISIEEVQIVNFSSSAPGFSVNETITLSWQTLYASSCALSTKEAGGSISVPVENGTTASCNVRSTPDSKTLILTKTDGSNQELGRIDLPNPCPLDFTFILTAEGSPGPKQQSYVVNLMRPQINKFDLDGFYDAENQVYWMTVTWDVTDASSVAVEGNGYSSTQSSWRCEFETTSTPSMTIVCQGFGGPISQNQTKQLPLQPETGAIS